MGMMTMMIYDRVYGLLKIIDLHVYQFHHSSDKDRQSILTTQDMKITKPHEETKAAAQRESRQNGWVEI
jgi:hypothetical protein